MNNRGLKYLIITLANCIVYSGFYAFVEENSLLEIIWSLSHYVLAALSIKNTACVIDSKNRSRLDIAQWILMVILIIGVIFCAFFSTTSLPKIIKTYIYMCEIVLILLILMFYYKLSHNIINKNIEDFNEKDVIDNKENNILNFNCDDEFNYVFYGNQSLNRKAISILWINICSCIICIDYTVIPLILRAIQVDKQRIIYTYSIALLLLLLLLLGAILWENILYYEIKLQMVIFTIIESIGIVAGCILDAYLNVYIGRLNPNISSTYFIPYLIMGLGTIPFMLSAKKSINEYNKNKEVM